MANDARPTCERCRRPKATTSAYAGKSACYREWWGRDAECDRLLLERAQTAEAERDEARAEARRLGGDIGELGAIRLALEEERDALRVAGEALAGTLDWISTEYLNDRDRLQAAAEEPLARWRSLRSPKGADNGD